MTYNFHENANEYTALAHRQSNSERSKMEQQRHKHKARAAHSKDELDVTLDTNAYKTPSILFV